MATTIRLLGRPALLRDGVQVPDLLGSEGWALLGYLLLSGHPATREELATLELEAGFPELRRVLGDAVTIAGDPVRLELAPDVSIDDSAGGILLDGVSGGPAFAAWLRVMRRRVAGHAESVLHETALAELAAGRPAQAAEYAARLVASDPFDEANHELLVRSLIAAGDRAGALAQVTACRRLFREQLGTEPSPALRNAAGPGAPVEPMTGGGAAGRGQLEAGEAAMAAGALEYGLSCLRRACTEAAICGDGALGARSLTALGTALVHAVRGRDEEGAAVLHQALAVAESAGDRESLVAALRELAYTDIQAGRRAGIESRLARAAQLAEGDAEHAAILTVQGMNHSDMGDYPRAFAALESAIERAERAGDRRRLAFALSLLARAQLLREETDAAGRSLDRALAIVDAERWLAFQPFPEAMRGEVDLRHGRDARASERFEHAYALACELADPCWEGLAARNLGLLHRARGEEASSRGWIDEARARSKRLPDRYVWMHGHVLDTAIELGLEAGEEEQTTQLIDTLAALAARTEMRELVVRGLAHAARIGQAGALDSARVLAVEIENPTLETLLVSA